jgi:chromosome partitioning protein
MKGWSVANQKGGVGKTTALTLGGMLAESGFRTLLVDLDPHGSLTAYFGFDPDALIDGVYSLFETEPEACDFNWLVPETGTENLSLLPASTAMATLDRQLGAREGMGLILAKALERVSARYD